MSIREMWLLYKLRSADTSAKESFAKDPRTPSSVLNELARDTADSVRLAVASHPKVQQNTLYALGHDSEQSVRASALTQLLQLEGIGSSSDALRQPSTSPQLLAVIAEDLRGYSNQLQELCGTGYVSGDRPKPRAEVLVELAKTRNPVARAEVAKSRFAPPSLLDSLVGDPDETVRVALAGNSSATPGALGALLPDPSATVRRQLAARADLLAAHLTQLAKDEAPDVRRTAAANASTPDGTLVSLASDPDVEVRLVVARGVRRVGGPLSFFEMLEGYSGWELSAGDRSTPAEALRTLARDDEGRVRMAVAGNPRLPIDAFVTLAGDHDATVRKWLITVEGVEAGDLGRRVAPRLRVEVFR